MNVLQTFRMSMKAIFGKKVRSFLTMLGIVIGVAAVITLVSLQSAQNAKNMEWFLKSGSNKINVYANTWNSGKISEELYKFVTTELTDLTLGTTPNTSYWGFKTKYKAKTTECPVYFGSDQFGLCNNFKIAQGRDLSYMDIRMNNRVVVLGSVVQKYLFNYKNPVGENVFINGQRFTVVGVYESLYGDEQWGMDNMILLPYSQMRLMWKEGRVSEYVVKAKDALATQEAMERLRKFLAPFFQNEHEYGVYSSDEYMGQVEEMNRQSTLMLAGIAAISLLVGGIGIMNIMLVTVTERTREIGIRKAIGAPRRSIILQFLIEASVLSLCGGLLGVFLGTLVTVFWGKMSLDLTVFPDVFITVVALGVSILLGVGFGIYPAAKASKLQPVVALRNE